MRTVLLVGTLLVLSVVATGVGTTSIVGPSVDTTALGPTEEHPTQEDAPINRVGFLTLDEPDRQELESQSVDVGAAIAIGRDNVAETHEQYTLEEKLSRSNDAERVLSAAIEDVGHRIETYRDEARVDRRRFANGSLDTSQFVRNVAHRQAVVERLRTRLSTLQAITQEQDAGVLTQRIDRIQREVVGHNGPVRTRALGAIRGTDDEGDFYVSTSENGAVLSVLEGDSYVREAFRSDYRRFGPAEYGLLEAVDRAQEVYPLAYDRDFSLSTGIRGPVGNSWFIDIQIPFGTVESYLDWTTHNVFSEVQRRTLSDIDQPRTAQASANGTKLLINRSYAGGPLRIATVDNATGSPVESTILLADRQLQTGADGVVWSLMPPRPRTPIKAIRPSGNTSTTVYPFKITSINGR